MKKAKKPVTQPPKQEPKVEPEPQVKPKVGIKLPNTKSQEDHSEHSDFNELSHAESFLWEDMNEGEAPEKEYKLQRALSRTSWLIEDYRRFKAARVIQTRCRGWFTRHMFLKKRKAAITIQTEWRRFHAKRIYYKKLENTLQQRIVDHYFRCAQRIQALYRGWWVRMYVHDHRRLTGLQVSTAEELLHCIAFKLHHLLRTRQIPGVYSLRNSNCFSKVEKLLTTISFKQHNNHVRWAAAQRAGRIDGAKNTFKQSAHATQLPFAGPNLLNLCEPKCYPLYNQRDADIKMYKILSLYQTAEGKNPRESDARLQKIAREKERKSACVPTEVYKSPCDGKLRGKTVVSKSPRNKKKKKIQPTDFCTDVVESMKRWNILTDNNLSVDPNIFKKPEKLEQFLEEIQSIYNMMQTQCHCRVKAGEMPNCMQTHA